MIGFGSFELNANRGGFHMLVRGHIVRGCGHFQSRIANHPDVFENHTGQELFPGTLNVKIDRQIKVTEDFRIRERKSVSRHKI